MTDARLGRAGFPHMLRPDGLQDFGKPRAALGELLALDGVHGSQISHVVIERDRPSVELRIWQRIGELEPQAFEGVLCDEDRIGRPCLWPALDGTLTGR